MIASSNTKLLFIDFFCIVAVLICMAGCAPLQAPPTTLPPAPTQPSQPAPLPGPSEPEPSVDPRLMASVQLTEQGRLLLDQGRVDDAIRTLERAISLSPRNGKTYYYMAEAWLAKGAYKQASEFNRLAAMYLEDTRWSASVAEQRRKIESGGMLR